MQCDVIGLLINTTGTTYTKYYYVTTYAVNTNTFEFKADNAVRCHRTITTYYRHDIHKILSSTTYEGEKHT